MVIHRKADILFLKGTEFKITQLPFFFLPYMSSVFFILGIVPTETGLCVTSNVFIGKVLMLELRCNLLDPGCQNILSQT